MFLYADFPENKLSGAVFEVFRDSNGNKELDDEDELLGTMEETLNLGWELLGRLPKEELDRVDTKILDKYYHPTIYDDTTTATSSPGSIANQN